MSARRWKTGTADERFNGKVKGDRVLKALFETMVDQENRLRALEGKQPVSRDQALSALKARAA